MFSILLPYTFRTALRMHGCIGSCYRRDTMRPPVYSFSLLVLFFAPGSSLAQQSSTIPVAAPGLSIPNTTIPWALDSYNGQSELVPIHHADISVNRHTGKNLAGSLAGSFLYRPEMTTELEGEHARAQLHSRQPVLYFHRDEDDDHADNQGPTDKSVIELVPAKIVKARRVVDDISFNQFTTHAKRKVAAIAVTIDALPNGWFKLQPQSPLAEGEYVLVFHPARAELIAMTVYPFGIDQKTAESTEAVHPAATVSESQ